MASREDDIRAAAERRDGDDGAALRSEPATLAGDAAAQEAIAAKHQRSTNKAASAGEAATLARGKAPVGRTSASHGAHAVNASDQGQWAHSDELAHKRRRRANVAAFLTVMFVGLFAVAFVGVVTILNDYADQLDVQNNPDVRLGSSTYEEPFYVVLIGSDSRKGTAIYNPRGTGANDISSADVVTLMRIDPETYRITLLSIPRDAVVPEGNGAETGNEVKVGDALNSEDPQAVVDAVERLAGIQVNSYLMATFVSFENLVNAIGGIDMTVPVTVKQVDPATGKNLTVKRGKNQHLNGSQALVVARASDEYNNYPEALRQANVRAIERAMLQKILDGESGLNVEHVIAALDDDTKSNIDLGAAGALMVRFMEHHDEVTIYDGTAPYAGKKRASDKEWVVPYDEQSWTDLMAAVDAGRDPSTVVKSPSFSK